MAVNAINLVSNKTSHFIRFALKDGSIKSKLPD